jgi:O-antigen ligase
MFAKLFRGELFTPLEPFYFLFLATAFLGMWTSFDRGRASVIFIAILAGYLAYSLIGFQPLDRLVQFTHALGLLACFLVVHFILSNNWQTFPADFEVINRVGGAWMQVRPNLTFPQMHPNMFAGIIASILPLSVANILRCRNKIRSMQGIYSITVVVILGFGLFLSSSRAAWVALFIGLCVWASLAWFLKRLGKEALKFRVFLLILFGVLLIIIAGGLATKILPNIEIGGSLGSRLGLAKGSWELAKDMIWTGGGLGSFAGLYSSYILLIPVPMFFYSHNLYLDILVEQGIFGVIAWMGLLFGGAWLLLSSLLSRNNRKRTTLESLILPIFAGVIVLILHGLVDNPFYETWSRPLQGLFPGMCVAVSVKQDLNFRIKSNWILLTIPFVILLGGWFYRPLRASIEANIGSVNMARMQLKDWPSGKWQTADKVGVLSSAKEWFYDALKFDSSNRTANYRLGLIALQEENFKIAVTFLQEARRHSPDHRGVRKALGYALTWMGENQQAVWLLSSVPEAVDELDVYSWWWNNQGNRDLAEKASQMNSQLTVQSGNSP